MAKMLQNGLMYAAYIKAIILHDVGLGIIRDVKYMITPGVWFYMVDGRPYLFKVPRRVAICHIPKGFTTRVVQYDVRHHAPLDNDILLDMRRVLDEIADRYNMDADFLKLIRATLGRAEYDSIEKSLKKIDMVRKGKLIKTASRTRDAASMERDLAEWVSELPAGILVQPMGVIHGMLGSNVKIQSAAYVGNVVERAIQYRNRLETLSNTREKSKINKTMIYIIAFSMLGVLAIIYFAMDPNSGIDLGIDNFLPNMNSGGAVAPAGGGDPCSPESLMANYVDGTAAAIAIHKGELPCDPEQIGGQQGIIIRDELSRPDLLDWIIENEDIAGGGPMDAVTGAVEELAP